MRVRNRNIQQRMTDQLKKYNLVYNEATGLYDCDGNVKVEKDLVSPDGKLVVKFGVVKGDFDCSYINLTSLIGAPQKVGKGFYCYENQLTSLEGAPQEVGQSFYCYENQLTSLKGSPQKVGGGFDCHNNKLTSLEGEPKVVCESFDCHANKLIFDETHFYGCLPDVIGDELVAGKGCDYELAKDYYDNE